MEIERGFGVLANRKLFSLAGIVLSLGDDAATRKLVRLLLADPLGPKEDWEDYLDSYDMSSSQGLLIWYGLSGFLDEIVIGII